MLRLGLAVDRGLDPGRLATVAVRLDDGEGERLGVREGTAGQRELLELPRADPAPAAAVNSTTEIASVISFPSSSVTGGSSRSFVVVAVHPGIGCVRSDASGVSVGIWMRTFTVLAASLSLGTRKVTLPKPPGVASVDETPTWAEARPVEATIAVNAASRTTASRTRGRGRDTELLFIGGAPVSARGSRCWLWSP